MEPQPRARAALAAAVLLLHTLGSASPHCGDCDGRSGPLTKRCPAGHFLKRSCTPPCGTPTCAPCQDGTFMAHENHSFVRCVRCKSCDEGLQLTTLWNCSAKADTHCGCQPGWYPQCWDSHCRDSDHIMCRPCTDCRARNRRPLPACEDPLTAVPPSLPRSSVPPYHLSPAGSGESRDCGACLDDFYEHRNNCVSCPT